MISGKNFQFLNCEISDAGILTLVLNRPEALNALSAALLDELSEVFHFAALDKTVKGLILTGTGKAFCAGADIKELLPLDASSGFLFAQKGQVILNQLAYLPKPSVVALQGSAFGGGLELALAAHLRIASPQVQVGQPEVKLGVIPGFGGTQRLARLIGRGRALEWCLSGRSVSAEEALQAGLISFIYPPETLLAEAERILKNILTMGPLAIESILATLHQGPELSLDHALHLEALHFAQCCATKDKNIGVQAFLTKQAPLFKGRTS